MNIQIDFKELGKSKTFRRLLGAMIVLIFLLVVFQAGVTVGYRKAAFSYHFGDAYYKTFDNTDTRGLRGIIKIPGLRENAAALPGGYGAVGKIVRVNLPIIIVAGPDNIEKIILIGDDTSIRRFRDTVSPSELKVDDFAVILGTPNSDGQINAKLIRVVPPQEESTSTKTITSLQKE